MRIDVHCHAMGKGRNFDEIYYNIDDIDDPVAKLQFKIMHELVMETPMLAEGDRDGDFCISTEEYFHLVFRLLKRSEELDGIVLLALDAKYTEEGALDEQGTCLCIANGFLKRKVDELNDKLNKKKPTRKKFFFGASVNPNKIGWEDELREVKAQGAVLVKLIPSVQGVDLNKHADYFKLMADLDLPLLCHTGIEHAFPTGRSDEEQKLNDCENLRAPLNVVSDSGKRLTVIGAHCNCPSDQLPGWDTNETHLFQKRDTEQIDRFLRLMEEYNTDDEVRLWGDTAALSLFTKVRYIRDIAEKIKPEWLLHGTDYPVPIDGWARTHEIPFKMSTMDFLRIRSTLNPFDRDIRIKDSYGFLEMTKTNFWEKIMKRPRTRFAG